MELALILLKIYSKRVARLVGYWSRWQGSANWPRSRTEIFLSTAAILEIRSLDVRILDIVELYVFLAQRKRFITIGVDVEESSVQTDYERLRMLYISYPCAIQSNRQRIESITKEERALEGKNGPIKRLYIKAKRRREGSRVMQHYYYLIFWHLGKESGLVYGVSLEVKK